MTIKELSDKLGLQYIGIDFEVATIESLQTAEKNHLSYLENDKYIKKTEGTKAGAIMVEERLKSHIPSGIGVIISQNTKLDMARASAFFAKPPFELGENSVDATCKVAPNATICKGAKLAKNVRVMSGAIIGANVQIGEGTQIFPNAVIYDNTIIGKNCIIQAGAKIGVDGYGYAQDQMGNHTKIHHLGNCVLEDDVEIGANTTVDRGAFHETRIGTGSKIDNLVQIGHNTITGPNCLIVSQVGISGSTTLGRNVVMGGQSASAGHARVGDFVQIAARGAVVKDVPDGSGAYAGYPLIPYKEWLRMQAKMVKFFQSKPKK